MRKPDAASLPPKSLEQREFRDANALQTLVPSQLMRQIHVAIGAATVDPAQLTAAEHIQYEGYLRRGETNGVILALAIRAAQACDHQGWVTPLPETLLFQEPINAQRPPSTPGEQ